MIKLSNISIQYDEVLLQNSEIQFYGNSFHLITGKSGCGKSSLLYIIGLIANPKDVEYTINSKPISTYKNELIKRYNIGYVLQDLCLFEQYDVLGNLKLYSSFINKEYSEDEYKDILCQVSLNVPLNQTIDTLSGGERQRLQIACALCKDPDILILDEPTNALDESNERIIFELLVKLAHQYHKCVIVASHSYYAKEYADYIYQIENKKIIAHQKNNTYSTFDVQYYDHKLSISFYFKYIRYFIKKYMHLNILLITILSVLSLISFSINSLIHYYMNISKNEMISLCENQLFITDNKNDLYINDLDDIFDSKKIKDLKEINNDIMIHPYFLMKASISGEDVFIFPYFDQNNLEDKTLCYIDSHNTHGAYYSYDVYRKLSSQLYKLDTLNTYLEIEYQNNDDGDTKQIALMGNIEFKAALKENVYSAYQPNCRNYIYVYYKDLENLYYEHISSSQVFGYTIFTKDFNDYNHLIDELIDMDIGVNQDFVNLDALNNLVNSTSLLNSVIQTTILILFTILICTVQLTYFYKRNREFALLSTNGLSSNQLLKLVVMECFIKFLITFCLSMIFNSMLGYLINPYFDIYELMNITKTIISNYLMILIIITLLSKIYLYKLVPEKILRK